MGLLAPNILELGDISHFAALLAPRPFVLTSAVEPDGQPSTPERIRGAFEFTERIYRLLGAADRLALGTRVDSRKVLGRRERGGPALRPRPRPDFWRPAVAGLTLR